MDFIAELPRSPKSNDRIWVVVDRLTKSTHFIPILTTDLAGLGELYVDEVVRLYEVSVLILLDRDMHFMSKFWEELQNAMGTTLHFSTLFHPQTDGQSE